MALTDAQKLSCFEILGITYGPGGGTEADTAQIHTGFGVALTLTQMDTLRDKVTAYLDGLASAVETRVAAIVAAWDESGFNIGKIADGSVGDAGGISFDWNAKRELLRNRLQHYIPVMHLVESVARRDGPRGSCGFVQVIR